MIVETYPIALKKFMKFTKMKSVTLAEYIGYDVSYISKWINGAKLPSSRAIERVNEDAAALFAETIEKLDRRQDCCRYFSFPADTPDLVFAISDYLSRAYRTSLQSGRTEKAKKSWPVRIVTSHQKVAHFLKDLFRKKLPTLTGKEELVIYGEFFDFYDDGFWSYLDVPSHYKLLRITWEEIIAKARVSVIVPTPSFMRYLETGHIDLTDVQYTLTPAERIDHLKTIARTLNKSQGITLSTMHLSPAFLAYKEANLSFYSNYRMSFFKKNTLAMNSQADPFYIIVDKDLDAMVLDFFDNMTKSAYCHPCSSLELEGKIKVYQHMLEKITSLAGT